MKERVVAQDAALTLESLGADVRYSFRQLLRTEAEFGPSLRDTAGKIPGLCRSTLRPDSCPLGFGPGGRRALGFVRGSHRGHAPSVRLTRAGSIGT